MNPARPNTSTRPMTMTTGGMLACFFSGDASLFAANGHLPNLECRRGEGAAELQVGAYRLQAHQHLLQRARDRNLRDGEGQFAVADPQPRRAARVIARYDIDAEADQFRH